MSRETVHENGGKKCTEATTQGEDETLPDENTIEKVMLGVSADDTVQRIE